MRATLTVRAIVNRSVHWLTVGLLLPVFAVFQIDRGLSLTRVGLNVAIMSGVVAILELPTGGLADTFGRRNTYMLSLIFQFCGALVLAVAFSPPMFVTGFVFMGISRALSSGSMDAAIIDAHRELEGAGSLQQFLARIGVAVPLALAAGGLAGGFVAEWAVRWEVAWPMGLSFRLDRYSPLFFVVAFVVIAQMVLTVLLFPERESQRRADGIRADGIWSRFAGMGDLFGKAIRQGLRNRVVVQLLMGAAAWGIAFAGLEQYWQPYVNGITAAQSPTRIFGFLTGGYFLVGSLGAIASGLLFRRIGPRYTQAVIVLRVMIGLLFIFLARTASVASFAIVYFTLFFLNGISSSPEQTLLNEHIPGELRSTILSFESLFLQAGGGLAALVWGIVADRWSISLAWHLGGGIFLISGVLYYLAGVKFADTGTT